MSFSDDCIGSTAKKAVNKLNNGEVLVLENLRFYKQEKQTRQGVLKQLSDLDVYVNDAFGIHRNHTSTTTVRFFSV